VIELPPGLKMLSLNGRYHWSERNRRNAAIRKAAWALALNAKIPRLERVSVTVTYQPPDRHRRDADNIAMAAKAAIDGISAAGVVEGDWSEHVTEVVCRIGERYPKGRLVIAITEAPGGAP
jgi:Holliday junction resolvase RusA-like endonuclease